MFALSTAIPVIICKLGDWEEFSFEAFTKYVYENGYPNIDKKKFKVKKYKAKFHYHSEKVGGFQIEMNSTNALKAAIIDAGSDGYKIVGGKLKLRKKYRPKKQATSTDGASPPSNGDEGNTESPPDVAAKKESEESKTKDSKPKAKPTVAKKTKNVKKKLARKKDTKIVRSATANGNNNTNNIAAPPTVVAASAAQRTSQHKKNNNGTPKKQAATAASRKKPPTNAKRTLPVTSMENNSMKSVLVALKELKEVHISKAPKSFLYSILGFANASIIKLLKTKKFIEEVEGENFRITKAGRKFAGHVDPPKDNEGAFDLIRKHLTPNSLQLFNALVDGGEHEEAEILSACQLSSHAYSLAVDRLINYQVLKTRSRNGVNVIRLADKVFPFGRPKPTAAQLSPQVKNDSPKISNVAAGSQEGRGNESSSKSSSSSDDSSSSDEADDDNGSYISVSDTGLESE